MNIYMRRILKRNFAVLLLLAITKSASAFSLLGPLLPDLGGEPWQVDVIGYNLGYYQSGLPGGDVWLGDIGGPHNIGEEYRRNVPVLYYTYDPSFTAGDFFGEEALAAVEDRKSVV